MGGNYLSHLGRYWKIVVDTVEDIERFRGRLWSEMGDCGRVVSN